ncbi:Gly-X carboxypeptidase [Scheffersomyces stipitis CBS 6054]|uniref:Gly-X carboxypeptidase n=1 Tax=Scheffersomyces stipitis (strain ATCC 58785 / CBS 6054 / NBRC 10063 / NRRL Y-11545) TaxID=322104 RepID=A3GGM0_PICST|nr:Gly-X carboxypeptidase [Scheffersomyces stipitis CBS 6054]EAZ63548.2 Gly-X carboxypeptidase [Scheffersomyces stipitis CBS 6054]KAG2735499.1 hypothetical protein G9P44_001713 [Scheffersomyces stipitis]
MPEKTLPIYQSSAKKNHRSSWSRVLLSIAAFSAVVGWWAYSSSITHTSPLASFSKIDLSSVFGTFSEPLTSSGLCPTVEKLDPSEFLYNNETLDRILHDEAFKAKSRERLLGAIRVPTESYDDLLNPNSADTLEDLLEIEPRWKPFIPFHKYLEDTFPLVHKNLKVEKVNKFALVYTWEGSSNKKPILLAAHQDVVPIQKESLDQWDYPPYEGGYDGEWLYGRGSADCKSLLIGLLETIELLLEEGHFNPQRTIVLAFGYDEESAGTGAEEISKHLLKRYGPDSFMQIIDEGSEGYVQLDEGGVNYIIPCTSEKGHLDSVIELYTPGGHSSVPPDHTSIGILARLIANIEDKQFDSILTRNNPLLHMLYCYADYSTELDDSLRSDIYKAHLDVKSNENVIEFINNSLKHKYIITTSQAVDVIGGGVKANALPEHVSVLVNHRIAVEESVAVVVDKIVGQVKEIAEKFSLGVIVDGKVIIEPTDNGHFVYNTVGALEPAPVTPNNGHVWETYGGALRYLYEDLIFPESSEPFVFAPIIGTGNTDTKSYWDLTKQIYRYQPGLGQVEENAHTVNEKIQLQSHFTIISFYYYYLQLADKLSDE